MDEQTLLDSISKPSKEDESHEEHDQQSALQWREIDGAFLNPNNLSIPKVQHAWERKPLSPFSRQRLRVGKVWKRPVAAQQRPLHIAQDTETRATKKVRRRKSFQSPGAKPVKKLCLDSDFGISARILQWDHSGSPVRKITTRSTASPGEIVALPEDDGEDDDKQELNDDVTVEIINDDGTIEEAAVEDLENGGWEDEDVLATNGAALGSPVHQENTSTGNLLEPAAPHAEVPAITDFESRDAETTGSSCAEVCVADSVLTGPEFIDVDAQMDEPMGRAEWSAFAADAPAKEESDANTAPTSATQNPLSDETVYNDNSVLNDAQAEESLELPLLDTFDRDGETGFKPAPFTDVVLPEGFVSPAKQPHHRTAKPSRSSLSSRRRTLPFEFAPAIPEIPAKVPNKLTYSARVADDIAPATSADIGGGDDISNNELNVNNQNSILGASENVAFNEDDQEWEDVEDEDRVEDRSGDSESNQALPSAAASIEVSDVGFEAASQDQEPPDFSPKATADHPCEPVAEAPTPQKDTCRPSSPADHEHGTVFEVRTSPRRKSSSPVKRRAQLAPKEVPHFVACTPIKLPLVSRPAPLEDSGIDAAKAMTNSSSDMPERAASAPPDEASASPLKTCKPRLSDDTAILQAFLNRAAEHRNERRLSANVKESISNRRDSDTVRQALASPAKTEVLVDLDPNSPSPRKSSTGSEATEAASEGAALKQNDDTSEDVTVPRTRRSERAGRRANPPMQPTPSAPNKISIRGNSDNVVLRRTEAQETALLTRNNTRKNKGSAVLPPLRLTRIPINEEPSPQAETVDLEAKDGKSVQWAENLVEFCQAVEVPDESTMSDEPALSSTGAGDSQAHPPPPSETPSKPKLRRLQHPRTTASTPAKAPAVSVATAKVPSEKPHVASETAPTAESEAAPRAKQGAKKRSRIATPAKSQDAPSLLSAALPQPTASAPTSDDKAHVTHRRVVSKLPAPTTASSLGQGKENLIASPAKKKASAPGSRTLAPKLDLNPTRSKLDLGPAATGGSYDETQVPGLTSPAKKGGRRGVLFSASAVANFRNNDDGFGGGGRPNEDAPGLASPAKKRTRRMP